VCAKCFEAGCSFTIIYIKIINSDMFRSLEDHHQGVRCIYTSFLEGKVYITLLLLLYDVKDTAVYNNFRCGFIHNYFTCVFHGDETVGIETCWSIIFRNK
jgi:hypothetical protein